MNGEPMKKEHSNPVPAEIQVKIDALTALPEAQIDTMDVEEVGE
jgi:hypothetical protein